ncbi:hypothetical protein F4779DRAFT_522092 [Xylariaceae sp. FL0662B]|nr:hypothetical protein F4779DRAFT_522092 [Xylariaceae sp. FL0662B]
MSWRFLAIPRYLSPIASCILGSSSIHHTPLFFELFSFSSLVSVLHSPQSHNPLESLTFCFALPCLTSPCLGIDGLFSALCFQSTLRAFTHPPKLGLEIRGLNYLHTYIHTTLRQRLIPSITIRLFSLHYVLYITASLLLLEPLDTTNCVITYLGPMR